MQPLEWAWVKFLLVKIFNFNDGNVEIQYSMWKAVRYVLCFSNYFTYLAMYVLTIAIFYATQNFTYTIYLFNYLTNCTKLYAQIYIHRLS